MQLKGGGLWRLRLRKRYLPPQFTKKRFSIPEGNLYWALLPHALCASPSAEGGRGGVKIHLGKDKPCFCFGVVLDSPANPPAPFEGGRAPPLQRGKPTGRGTSARVQQKKEA